MATWKIEKDRGRFFPYRKSWFFGIWTSPIDSGGDNGVCVNFATLKEAEDAIYRHEHPEAREVVKTIESS